MINFKLIRGVDGNYRKYYYDSEGYMYFSGYAKDFQNVFIIGESKQASAQDLIDEVVNNGI